MGINYSPKIVTDGLVLCLDAANPLSYPGSGNTWYNLVNNQYNAPLFFSYSTSNGGNFVFDGATTSSIGNVLDIADGQFALEFFAKKNSGGNIYSRIAAKGYYLSAGWNFYFGTNPSGITNISFNWGNPWLGIGGFIASLDTWYHGIVTRTEDNILALYINGIKIDSIVTTYNFSSPFTYRLGCNSNGTEIFKGNLAFWRHYNKGLTANEVQQNYLATKGRFGL